MKSLKKKMYILACLVLKAKENIVKKKKKRKTKASNGIARIHHEKKRKERKRKGWEKMNKVEQEWLH